VERLRGPHRRSECGNFAEVHPDCLTEAADRISTLERELEEARASTAGLATMSQHLGWELDWGLRDPNDEGGECGWRVHDRRGNRSDREWTLIGFGASPAEALRAAALTRSQP
jgi:hypothetical protein